MAVNFKLEWDKAGEHLYETGIDRGVLYPQANNGTYPEGVAWNGLTKVSEKPTGAEATKLWADNIKYLNLYSAEEFEATIEAYTYPDEFAVLDGSAEIATGVMIGQQNRKSFGLCYRTVQGNDIAGNDYGYKLHLIYGAQVSPSEKSYETINDSPSAITFSWEMKTTPVSVTGFKPTACVTIDSTKVESANLAALEQILYGTPASGGTAAVEPRMPLPDEIAEIFGASLGSITLDKHVLNLTVGGANGSLEATTVPVDAVVDWDILDSTVATVSSGTVTPAAAGSTVVIASITVEGQVYYDSCTVTVASGQ